MATSVGSPRSAVAWEARTAASSSSRVPARVSLSGPLTSSVCPDTQTKRAVIRFCVSVPVLSVQITVVAPSVSTEDSRFTRHRWRAMRCTPSASARVSVGSSPSGTLATITPRANKNPSATGSTPAVTPSTKNPTPKETARTVTIRVTRPISRWRGLGSSTTAWVRWAIVPISVRMPVARTTRRPLPATTPVPANTSSCRSGRGTLARLFPTAASLKTGFGSPVSALWSTRSPAADRSWPSAGTWSPSSSRTRSPGTSAVADRRISPPSRSAVISRGSISWSASTARSARYSWKKLNTPLTTITAKMAQPSSRIPAKKAKAPATQSRTAKKLQNCSRKRPKQRPASDALEPVGPARAIPPLRLGGEEPRRAGAEQRQQIVDRQRGLSGDPLRLSQSLHQGLPGAGRARGADQTRVLKARDEPGGEAQRVFALGDRRGQHDRGLDRCRAGNQPRARAAGAASEAPRARQRR